LGTTEDKRVAAFKPHNHFTGKPVFDQQVIDLWLLNAMVVGVFANVDDGGVGASPLQNLWRDQSVVDDRVALLDQSHAANSD